MLDILLKNFYQSVQKQRQEGKRKKKEIKKKGYCKDFCIARKRKMVKYTQTIHEQQLTNYLSQCV